jgi:TonB family protein
MKLPFSYQRDGWSPALLASMTCHALAFLGVAIAPTPARYGVEAGFSSLEVVISKETPPPATVEIPKENVIALEETAPVEPTVPREKPPEEPPPQQRPEPQPTPIVSEQGAQQEAKPDYLSNPAPVYPRLARQQGWEGVVMLRVLVRADGTVEDIEVEASAGHQILDDAAVSAVRRWKFLPARLGRLALSSEAYLLDATNIA